MEFGHLSLAVPSVSKFHKYQGMTLNLLCSLQRRIPKAGIVRTNRPLNTEESIEVSQQSFQTCPELGTLPLFRVNRLSLHHNLPPLFPRLFAPPFQYCLVEGLACKNEFFWTHFGDSLSYNIIILKLQSQKRQSSTANKNLIDSNYTEWK